MGFSCNPIFVTLSAEVARVKNKSVLKIENKLLARDQKLLEWGINMKIFLATCATNFGEKERLLIFTYGKICLEFPLATFSDKVLIKLPFKSLVKSQSESISCKKWKC